MDPLGQLLGEAIDSPAEGGGWYHDLLEAIPDGLVIVDETGQIVLVNRQAELILGYPREELLGMSHDLLLPERLRAGHARHRADYLAAPRTRPMGSGMELLARRRDGSEIPVEISLSALQADNGVYVTTIIRDISERRAAEQRIAHLAAIVSSSTDAIVSIDAERRIVSWNRGAELLLGWSAEEMIGRPGPTIIPPELAEERLIDRLDAGEQIMDYETVRLDRSGKRVPVSVTLFPMRDASGRRLGASAIMRSNRERRELERLRREFFAMVNHDLMNPVTAIGLHAQILQMTEQYSERSVQSILDSARRLERLVGDLLDISRLETGRLKLSPAEIDLSELLRRCVEQSRVTTEEHELELHVSDKPLLGRWDRDRLEQVCQNLLSNAIKYSPRGGEILVEARERGSLVQVSVTDHGSGMTPEEACQAFDRFYRAQAAEEQVQGLGLGLHITRLLIEAHGGRIWVESQVGRGSTFSFELPVSGPADAEADA
jgi:PAS domain S-box-containing protein